MLSSLAASGELLGWWLCDNISTYAEIPVELHKFLYNMLIYSAEDSFFPTHLTEELKTYFKIDIIPSYIKDNLAILYLNDDMVSAKAYSLGELLFPDWTALYPRNFEINPACVCSSNEENSFPQGISGENSENTDENEQNPQKPLQNLSKTAEITVKPNPTNGQLIIESGESKIENIEIFDVLGRKHEIIFNIQRLDYNSIDVSHLANGVYFLKITTTASEQYMKKIVKK